jgi:hypothetical protein
MKTTHQNTNPTPHISRDLASGSEYQPDWRHTVVQHYLVEIGKADDPSKKVAAIWAAEPDEYVLQLLLFHLNGPSPIRHSIDYAVRCCRFNFRTRIASQIKAMIVANFHHEEIAMHVGTEVSNIYTFAYLFFDIQNYRHRSTWLRSVCFPVLEANATPEAIAEARLLQIAFDRGERGIREAFLGEHADTSTMGRLPNLFGRMAARAADRAAEHYLALDVSGVPPTEHDLEVLSMMPTLNTFFDSPCMMADAGIKQPPTIKISEARIKELLSLDWEKAISLVAGIVITLREGLNTALHEQLVVLAEAEAKTSGRSPSNPAATSPKFISWRRVLQELTNRFGVDANNGNGVAESSSP